MKFSHIFLENNLIPEIIFRSKLIDPCTNRLLAIRREILTIITKLDGYP